MYALADAMRDKYRAIVESGFILQIDDPGIVTSWDMLKPEPSLADYRKYVTLRIESGPVSVARQVGEHSAGSTKGPFGIDHPFDLSQCGAT